MLSTEEQRAIYFHTRDGKLGWENTRTRVRLTTRRRLRMSCERMVATRCETLDRIVTAATTAMPPRRALKRRQSARTLPRLPSPPLAARHPHPAHTFPTTALGSRSTHVGTPLAATRLYSAPAADQFTLHKRVRLAETPFRGWHGNYRDLSFSFFVDGREISIGGIMYRYFQVKCIQKRDNLDMFINTITHWKILWTE